MIMYTDDIKSGSPENYNNSDTKLAGVEKKTFTDPLAVSGPLNAQKGGDPGSSRGGNDDDYIEITLDVRDDSVAVHSVKKATGADVDDPELALLTEQIASGRIRQVSEELQSLTSFSNRQPVVYLDRSKSAAAQALKGLRFIRNNDGGSPWAAVEKRFDELTNENDGFLLRSRFGECIGMMRDSREFAEELFDSLSRRRNITRNWISKAQLKDFWDQIADQSFDSRLQTFFDMVDKDNNGRITEEEVKEIIRLSASANKLSNIQKQADEYATLIMEALDPNNMGYIMIENLELLLLQMPTHNDRGEGRNLSDDDYDWETEDPEFTNGLEKTSSSGLSVVRNTSARIRLVSECNHLYSASKRYMEGRLDRTSSAFAHAFTGLQFISNDNDINMNSKMAKAQAKETRIIPLYAQERLARAFRNGIPVKILKVVIYAGNVLALYMSKPQGFNYKSGQYMLLKCAAISTFEWHPFYITAAPDNDYLSVHIRTLGDWTRELKTLFAKVCEPPRNGKDGLLRADYDYQGDTNPNLPRVLIDGPYSGEAQNYEKYEVVLLVSLGIGVTPMISIVKHIMNNMKGKEEDDDDTMENSVALQKNISGNKFRTKRVYFYWVTREQGSFDWFKDVINEVAEIDTDGVIEMHNYCTSVYEEGDARSALITMLQSLNHAKNGVDVVSGTRVKAHFGKPNWGDVYKRIALNHTGSRIGVFYSGASVVAKELKQLTLDFSKSKTSTNKFDFHKEKY